MTLALLVAAAAAAWPDRPAVVGADRTLTWADADRETRRLAHRLVRAGVEPGDRVGVARARGVESFLSMHGVLRSGAVAVPIDPMAPRAAGLAVLRDADIVALIADERCRVRFSFDDTDVGSRPAVITDADWCDLDPASDEALPHLSESDPAYLLYTSGSTGAPKGILHTHRSALAYARSAAGVHRLDETDRLAVTAPLHFDMSTLELYATPLVGAASVVFSEAELRFPATFSERCAAEQVTSIYAVPFLLQGVLERGALDHHDLSHLRTVFYAGEPLPPADLARLMDHFPAATFGNAYGPSETNVITSIVFDERPTSAAPLPIGTAWPDVELRIVDEHGTDVEAGSPGELLASGPTTMAGYWRRPDLDARALSEHEGRRWYATGDIVVAEGDPAVLHFVGRRDHQVKIRGHRIELEAVEAVLARAPGVLHAVAGPTAGNEALAAVVVARADAEDDHLAATSLRRWCSTHLTAASVPHEIGVVDDVPLTASGKIDRRAVRAALQSGPPMETT